MLLSPSPLSPSQVSSPSPLSRCAQVMTIVGAVRPKLRGLTVRKVLAAVASLREEASAFHPTGDTECDPSER